MRAFIADVSERRDGVSEAVGFPRRLGREGGYKTDADHREVRGSISKCSLI